MRIHLLTLLLLSVTAVWGWTFTVVKDAVDHYGLVSFLALRFAIATLALGVVCFGKICRATLIVGGSIGIVLAMAYLLQTWALRFTSPTNCGLITGLFVVFAPLANRIIFGVPTRLIFWAAIVTSCFGLTFLVYGGKNPPSIGDLMTLGAAACFGLHIALLDRFAKDHDVTVLTWSQLLVATLLFGLTWPMTEPIVWPTLDVWLALAICGLLATACCFWVQTFVQQRISAVRTAVLLTAEPVFALLFGFWLAGDRLTTLQIIGTLLMMTAVLVAVVVPIWQDRSRETI